MPTITQGPIYHCVCRGCGAVFGSTRPRQQPEQWREMQRLRVDHINAIHRINPDYQYPDFAAWEGGQSLL
jgi:hypothetical protein